MADAKAPTFNLAINLQSVFLGKEHLSFSDKDGKPVSGHNVKIMTGSGFDAQTLKFFVADPEPQWLREAKPGAPIVPPVSLTCIGIKVRKVQAA